MHKALSTLALLLALILPANGDAHLIDEVAESIVISIHTEDRLTFEAELAFHRARLQRYHTQAEQLGLPKARTDAAFSRRLQTSFSLVGCTWLSDKSESRNLGRGKFIAYRLRARCPVAKDAVTLRREDHDRAKTRTTLYITTQVGDGPVRRQLLPPRLAALSLPLTGATRAAPAPHGEEPGDEPQAAPTPGQPIDVSTLPPPNAQRGPSWLTPPPKALLLLWVEAGAKHLTGGPDHLALLLTLVLLGGSLASLAGRVILFSLGHVVAMAVAFALAVPTNVFSELAVAATVVWAGWVVWSRAAQPEAMGRVAMVFCGCVHGVAFGTELFMLMGSPDGLLWPLVGFGAGLDLAQLLYVGLLWAFWRMWPMGGRRAATRSSPRESPSPVW